MRWMSPGLVIYEDSTWAIGYYDYIHEGRGKKMYVTNDYVFLPDLKGQLHQENDSVYKLVGSRPNDQILKIWDSHRIAHDVECRGLFLKRSFKELIEGYEPIEIIKILYVDKDLCDPLGTVTPVGISTFIEHSKNLFSNKSIIAMDRLLKSIEIVKDGDEWKIAFHSKDGTTEKPIHLKPFKKFLHGVEYPVNMILTVDSPSMEWPEYDYKIKKVQGNLMYLRIIKEK